MKKLLMPAWLFLRRLNRLHRIMGIGEALRLVLRLKKEREIQVQVLPAKHKVIIRSGTSDVDCMEKILIDEEYKSPYPIDARFIVDAGANIGMATLYYSQKYPNAKIIAIEPEHSNYKILEKNCASLANVVLINAALWCDESKLIIQDRRAEKWSFSVTESSAALAPFSQELKGVTIQGILRDFGFGHIDILKVDIEGAECELFKTAAESWLSSVGQIVIELHDRLHPGCAQSLYAAVAKQTFLQEIRGENIFIKLGAGRE